MTFTSLAVAAALAATAMNPLALATSTVDNDAIESNISVGEATSGGTFRLNNATDAPISYAFYVNRDSITGFDVADPNILQTGFTLTTDDFAYTGTLDDLFTKAFIGFTPVAPGASVELKVGIAPAATGVTTPLDKSFGTEFMLTAFTDGSSPLLELCATVGEPIGSDAGCTVPAPPVLEDSPAPTPPAVEPPAVDRPGLENTGSYLLGGLAALAVMALAAGLTLFRRGKKHEHTTTHGESK